MDDSRYSNDDYTVAWICALDVELAAAQAMLDEEHPEPLVAEQDTNTYILGKICDHNVVITTLPTGVPGTNSAAVAATNLLRSFKKVRFGLMVGVGGGAPENPSADPLDDIHLGDVVVSTPSGIHGGVTQYDLGKTVQSGDVSDPPEDQSGTFTRTGSLNRPPTVLSTAVTKLRARARLKGYQIDHYLDEMLAKFPDAPFSRPDKHSDTSRNTDLLFSSNYVHREGQTDCKHCDLTRLVERRQRSRKCSAVHYGLIGSGNQVVRDAKMRDRLRKQEGIACFEMEAAGLMNDFPCLVVRGICDYCDSHKNKVWQPHAAAAAAAYTKELLSTVRPLAVSKTQPASEFVLALKTHTEVLSRQIHTVANDIGTKLDLAGLPYVAGAAFDSYVDGDNLDSVCMEDTRVDVLKTIRLWINSPRAKRVFWLNGMAGTGKSTIARTVATELKEQNQLGASFFFKRGERDRGGSLRFFPTIAWQLYKTCPSIRKHIRHAVETDPHVADQSLVDQFQHLIFNPLKNVAVDIQTSVTLIIDALDECSPESHVIQLIDLLAQLAQIQKLHIRIFLTSRPELAPREGFRNLTSIRYQDIILHDIAPKIIEQDIMLYLRTRLKHIRARHGEYLSQDWPGEQRIHSLTSMSTPLFIYAATICRFLGDPYQNPDMRLHSLIQDYDPGAYDMVHRMYEPILSGLLLKTTKREQERFFQDFQIIVGTIVTLAEPLSVADLAILLKIDKKHIAMRLKGLHSVLRIPKAETIPVRLLHKSFRDFLLDRDRHEEHQFWIDEEATHRMLATKSLDILTQRGSLRRNMLNIANPGTRYVNDDWKSKQLPSHIRYACRYWIYHLHRSRNCTSDDITRIHKFLEDRYLYLFEALALCGYASEMINMMNSLQELALGSKKTLWMEFLSDATRFGMANARMVQENPLQLYSSALIFAPSKSKIRSNFIHLKPSWISKFPDVSRQWAPLLHTISYGNCSTASSTFSENDEQVLLCSRNGIASLWNSACGILMQKFIFPVVDTDLLQHVLSSLQSDTIIFLKVFKKGYSVEVWSLSEGNLLHTLPVLENPVGAFAGISMCLSPDGEFLCLRRDYIQIWNVYSGVLLRDIQFNSRVSAACFSPDGKLLGYCLMDKTLGVLDVISGEPQWQIHVADHLCEPENAVLSVIKSRFLVYGAIHDSVELWDLTSHQSWLKYSTIRDCRALAATQDGGLLAIGELYRIWLCSPEYRTIHHVLELYDGALISLAFSPQGKYITANDGQGVQLWNVTDATEVSPLNAVSTIPLTGHRGVWVARSLNHRWTIIISDMIGAQLFHMGGGKMDYGRSLGGDIQKAVISPDRTFAITSHSSGQLNMWKLDPGGKLLPRWRTDRPWSEGIQCFGLLHNDNVVAIEVEETNDLFASTPELQLTLSPLQTQGGFRCTLALITLYDYLHEGDHVLAITWSAKGVSLFFPTDKPK